MMYDDYPWTITPQAIFKKLEIDPETGLTTKQIKQGQAKFGLNKITTQMPPSWAYIFFRQFKSLLVALLAIAALVAGMTGDFLDAIAIVLVLLVNSLIGFVTEVRAISSMESLRKMGQSLARVLRNGNQQLISSEELVPGDILLLEAGDVITADSRIIKSHNLNVDESSLTGESVPVEKEGDLQLSVTVALSERANMLMKGTSITKGVCTAVVTGTGMNTELGKIAILANRAEEEITPLEKRLDRLGKKLLWLTILISISVFLSGLLTGKDPILMIQTAIALAVATVPEGLPIVATIALAKGLWTMARENALINRLSAVETLGATSVIVTDKTGTLTENVMTVSEIFTEEGRFSASLNTDLQKLELFNQGEHLHFSKFPLQLKNLVMMTGLCNDAQFNVNEPSIGDPMEIALLRFFLDTIGLELNLKEQYPRVSEVPFDSQTKMMATLHRQKDKILVAIKGAPESVISNSNLCQEEKEKWREQNHQMARQGLRVLGVASREIPIMCEDEDIYNDLTFWGLVGLIDPARQDVPVAIAKCRQAGIRVVMATGDQAGTAVKIASDIGFASDTLMPVSGSDLLEPWSDELKSRLDKTSIFSRVSPEQKLRLVEYYQKQGYVVAMTGDGVNDAPALKKADIGVAMGMRGTQVAREASDMVLKDDRFQTIVFAVEQGRVIFANIRKFVIYLLSCNISEVFVVGIASVFSSQLPITPLQILFLNLVTDVFPALALGMGKGDETYLSRPPRGAEEKILEKTHWYFIFFYGSLITLTVLGLFYVYAFILKSSFEKVVTISFLTLGISQVFNVFNLRKSGSSFFSNDITKNTHIWGAVLFCVAVFLASVHIPFVQVALDLVPLTTFEWFIVIGSSFIPMLGQFFLRLR